MTDPALSTNDKKLLESFDISLFKSAVAYIQNIRHQSCKPVNISDGIVSMNKYKHKKEKIIPLIPIENRLVHLYKKYSFDCSVVKNKFRQDVRLEILEGKEKKSKKNIFQGQDKGNLRQISELLENDVNLKKFRRKSHGCSPVNGHTEDKEKLSKVKRKTDSVDATKQYQEILNFYNTSQLSDDDD